MNEILTILEGAADEIRGLRAREDIVRLMLENITVRLAVHQLRHGPIDYKGKSASEWNRLLELIEEGRLAINSSGEVDLDLGLLTPERLAAAQPKTEEAK